MTTQRWIFWHYRHSVSALHTSTRPVNKDSYNTTLCYSLHFRNLPVVLRDVFWDAIAPTLMVLAGVALVGLTAHRIKGMLYPPGPAELHKKAMLILQISFNRRACKKASDILWKAVQQDPSYAPAVLSLAALYIYKLQDGKAAVNLLDATVLRDEATTLDAAPCKTDARCLMLDAQALLAGQGHMLQSDVRQYEFLSLSYVVNSSSNSQASTGVGLNATGSKKER